MVMLSLSMISLGVPPGAIKMKGWNLEKAELIPPDVNGGPGVQRVAARSGGFVTNRMPFALDTLPEFFEKEISDRV